MKQTCILVLGMHRSGTSALTGLFSLLDVYLGSELMEANFANEKGYFENNILYKINEKLLAQINSSWNDVFYDKEKLDNIKEIDELKKAIKSEFEYAETFAIKDPRLAFLFPVYQKVLQDLDIDIKIILPYRNPIEVANSLHRRDGMPLEKGMLLWVYHFLLAEKFSRGYDKVFIGFDELMSNTQETIKKVDTKLHIDLYEKYEANIDKIDDFLEPNLKHHNISIDNLSDNVPIIVKKILLLKNKFDKKATYKAFDKIYDEFFSYQKLFYNSEIISFLEDLQKTKEELTQKEQALHVKSEELSKTKEILTQKDKALARTKEELTQKEQIIAIQQQEIEDLKNELVLFYEDSTCVLAKTIRKVKGMLK